MAHPFLDPTRPLPKLLGRGLDAIVDKVPLGYRPEAPSVRARARRYNDALAKAGRSVSEHARQEVRGAELQAVMAKAYSVATASPAGRALRRTIHLLIEAIRHPRQRAAAPTAKVLHLRARRHG